MRIRNALPWPLRLAGPLLVAVLLTFVLLPVVVVTIASFNEKAILSFPPDSYSVKWFSRVFNYPDFQEGIKASLVVTFCASLIALIVGCALSIAVKRTEFWGKAALLAVLHSPLVVPHFTLGLGLLILVSQISISRSYGIVILCHVMLVLPFVLRSVYVSMENLDVRLEHAAASLGASPLKVMLTVTIPLLAPGLFGGWMFAAIMSFSEFTASLFVTTQETQTLPVAMYNYVREFADPTLAALSVMYIGVTATILFLANHFMGLSKILNIEESK